MQALQWNYLLPAILGMLFHIFVIKVPSLKKRSEAANHPFSFVDYIAKDWTSIAGSFIGVLILLVCYDELIGIRPSLAAFSKWLFAFVGYTGSSIVQSVFSVTGNLITKVIDVKTNVADGIHPPVNPANKEGAEEIAEKETISITKNYPNGR